MVPFATSLWADRERLLRRDADGDQIFMRLQQARTRRKQQRLPPGNLKVLAAFQDASSSSSDDDDDSSDDDIDADANGYEFATTASTQQPIQREAAKARARGKKANVRAPAAPPRTPSPLLQPDAVILDYGGGQGASGVNGSTSPNVQGHGGGQFDPLGAEADAAIWEHTPTPTPTPAGASGGSSCRACGKAMLPQLLFCTECGARK